LGAWVYASKASHARLRLRDSVGGYTSSAYHSGTPGWEWLEVTATIDGATTYFISYLWTDITPAVDGTTIVYISQPILVFGSHIGEGNYQPKQQEVVWLEKPIPSNLLHTITGWSTVAATDLNIEADSDAMLSKGCKAIQVLSAVADSASAASGVPYIYLRADATQVYQYYCSPAGLGNDISARILGWQACDANGDVDYRISATGADTLDIGIFTYLGIQVN